MLRRGIVALMIAVVSVGTVQAEDNARPNRLMQFLRGPSIGRPTASSSKRSRTISTKGGVAHAVVADAEQQVPEVRQVSSRPGPPQLQPAEQPPQPTPVQYSAPENTVPVANQEFRPRTVSHSGYPAVPQQQGVPVVISAPQPVPMHFVSSAGMVNSPTAVSNPGNYAVQGQTAGPLYPGPVPGVPGYVGGSAIHNPAFHPHELMYGHRYKAMYGPFYHKVRGHWMVTPFGVWSKENWKLQGTTVDVKYKTHISPFALFHPPVIR